MKVSVITPCLNSEMYIGETIESVLSQRGSFEIEYFIVDGGSTDETVSIIKRYEELVESGRFPIKCNKVSIRWLSEKDNGMYDALAKGFKLVTGDIISYLNSDDFYLPNAFSVAVDIFEKYPDVDWITGATVGYNEKGQILDFLLPFKYKRSFIRKRIYGTILIFIQQESTLWRKVLLDDLDFNQLKQYRFAGDFYLWHTFSKRADLYIVQSLIGGFRGRPGQISQQRNEYLKEFFSIGEKKSFIDVVVAYVYEVITLFMPNIIKRKLNSKIIYYDDGRWVKKDGDT